MCTIAAKGGRETKTKVSVSVFGHQDRLYQARTDSIFKSAREGGAKGGEDSLSDARQCTESA